MIKSFIHKGLKEFFETGKSAKVDQKMLKRIKARLDTLDTAQNTQQLNLPGYDYHPLPPSERHSIHINGPWCITFEFKEGDAYRVDLEQYH